MGSGTRSGQPGEVRVGGHGLTDDTGHAFAAIESLDVGTVKVNAVFGGAPGGSAHPRRSSGQGVGYGPDLLREMVVLKAVHREQAVRRPSP